MTKLSTTRRSLVLALTVIGLLNLLGVSDCAKVEDTVTGPDAVNLIGSTDPREECFQDCRDEFFPLRDEELERHREAIIACDGDRECIEAANERNERILRQIRADFIECKRICHEQGGGGGGQ